jgi:hypothetical protein
MKFSRPQKDGSTVESVVISHWNKREFYLIPTIKVTRHFKRIGVTIFFLGWSLFFSRHITWSAKAFMEHFKK